MTLVDFITLEKAAIMVRIVNLYIPVMNQDVRSSIPDITMETQMSAIDLHRALMMEPHPEPDNQVSPDLL